MIYKFYSKLEYKFFINSSKKGYALKQNKITSTSLDIAYID